MRIGQNPEKSNTALKSDIIHRVIIPVYIPNLTEPYFKDGLEILKLCVNSLLKSIHPKTRISLINNGCCDLVCSYLDSLYKNEVRVDQLFNSKHNLGKINALFTVIKGNLEPIITVTDADVLFLPGWQGATETLLDDFPEAGMVSPVPSSLGYASAFINSTVYYAFFKGKSQFTNVVNPNGLLNFQKSIDRVMYNEYHLKQYLTISNEKSKAVVGCGHFVATFRAEVFEHAPTEVCKAKIVGGSENKYLDFPNDIGGFLRLATLDNYAYHLGNVKEDWMDTAITEEHYKFQNEPLLSLSNGKPITSFQKFVGKVLYKLCFVTFKKQFFRVKGLSKTASEHY